jgi:hypothetical protein
MRLASYTLITTTRYEGKGKRERLPLRPRYIELAVVPKFGEGTSSAAEAKQTAPIVQSAEEPTVVPKMPIVGPTKAKDDKAEGTKVIEVPEILSPPIEADLLKMQKAPVGTPKRRRMASVLDAVKGKCALGPFLSILVIECQHKCLSVNLCQLMDKVQIKSKGMFLRLSTLFWRLMYCV